MKKTLLAIIATVGLATASNAQLEIYVNGGMTDLAGSVYQMGPVPGGEAVADIHVENHSGSIGDEWVVSRYRINEIATWSDYLCWGHETDASGGTCYSASLMPTNPWTTPIAVGVDDGEAGVIAAHITPDPTAPGTVTYRYYISIDGQQTYMDSVDIEVSFSLELEDVAPSLTVGVSPNPASDNITINANGVESANIKMVDVLGNVVLKETMGSSKTVDVSKFRNGIYFIVVDAAGAQPISRKVIVRH